ncbi:MAG: methylated-DNA--[protein]-cysteine S-methyltransferase [archaeon]|nr:methylated-DNA--[protein]-cysteine S-methyltransferase [archaeon]
MHSQSKLTLLGNITITESEGTIKSLQFRRHNSQTGNDTLEEAFCQLEEYIERKRKKFTVSCDPDGTIFQKSVWKTLEEIPYGKTITYRKLAELSGHTGSCRAIGNTNRKNPIPIFIPCHRVVMSNGSIGGYAHGTNIKRKLLSIEGVLVQNQTKT